MDTFDFMDRLLRDEKIVWSGRPAQGLLLTGRDAFLIPFSLFWGGFIIFWETNALTQAKGQTFFALWGIPFVLVGLYLIVGRFLFDAWIRRGMSYAVTNKRILILRSGPFGKFTAVPIDRLPDASLSEGRNGRGTIRFGQQVAVWGGRGGFNGWTPALDPTPQFIGIENVRSVFDQVQQVSRGGS
jgi:hypothetical protein